LGIGLRQKCAVFEYTTPPIPTSTCIDVSKSQYVLIRRRTGLLTRYATNVDIFEAFDSAEAERAVAVHGVGESRWAYALLHTIVAVERFQFGTQRPRV